MNKWAVALIVKVENYVKEEIEKGIYASCSLEELRKKNKALYWDILPEQYETSYGNPVYAAKVLGKEMGQLLSFLYTELRGLIVYAFEKREWDFLVGLELFLQVYSEFQEYIKSQKEHHKRCGQKQRSD